MAGKSGTKIRVWDLQIRLFHWTLVLLMVVSYFTGHWGGAWMKWHFWSGYAILTLLIFRIAWGVVGSTTARFSNFVKGPMEAFAHLRDLMGKHGPYDAGHNAMGGAMVVVLILAVLAQAGTGLFSADTDSGLVFGPLTKFASEALVNKLTAFHHLWINVLLALAALHVLAVFTYLVWKRHNLIGAMITGKKPIEDVVPPGQPAPRLAFASGRLAVSLLVAAAAIVYFIVRAGG